MNLKKRKFYKKKTFWFIIIIFLFILSLFFYLILEKNKILSFSVSKVSALFGVKNLKFDITRLDSHVMHIKSLSLGNNGDDGVIFKDFILKISKDNQPHELLISGMKVHLWSVGGKIIIPGLSIPGASTIPKIESDADFEKYIPVLMKIPESIVPLLAPGSKLKINNSFIYFNCYYKNKLVTVPLSFVLDLNLDKSGKYKFTMSLNTKNLNLPGAKELSLRDATINIKSSGLLHNNSAAESIKADFSINLKNINYKKVKLFVNIPNIMITGHAFQVDNIMQCNFVLNFKNIKSIIGKNSITSINAKIPINFWYTDKLEFKHQDSILKDGFISIDNLKTPLFQTGPIKFTLKQNANEFYIDGSVSPEIFDGILPYLKIHSLVSMNLSNLSFKIKSSIQAQDLSFDLGFIKPKLDKFAIDFENLKIQSDIKFQKGKLQNFADLNISGVNIVNYTDNLEVNNLNLQCDFPNLPKLKSSPKQQIAFSSIKFGNFLFNSGNIDFQIESPKEIFLEKTNIQWCDGYIDLGALRLNLSKPQNIKLTLFCDRINVAKLIRQLNLASAEGKGSVAGRIPVSYQPGQVRINNAFLYSIPGEGGNIKIKNFDNSYMSLASTSLPLDITKEALADYNYKWIKLYINSKEQFLFIKLQLDGKPNRKLPFTLNENQVFVKDKENSAHFQGISFEFNFNNIPIDSLLNLKDSTGKIFH